MKTYCTERRSVGSVYYIANGAATNSVRERALRNPRTEEGNAKQYPCPDVQHFTASSIFF